MSFPSVWLLTFFGGTGSNTGGAASPLLPLISHSCICVCCHWPLMLSVESVRNANTECVSTSKKEKLSPSSPQHWGFMILLFIWLNPRGGAVYFQPAHCWSPTVSSAPDHSFHERWPASTERTRVPQVSSQGNMVIQVGSRRRFWCSHGRGESSTHTFQDGGWLPCIIQPW